MELKKQSNEVMTYVETFVVNETVDLIFANEKLDEWNGFVKELGLSGQTLIAKKEKSPVPFMHMKRTLVSVFEELCPVKVDVKKFDISPIPVEVLSLVSLSVNEKYFDSIEIWYDDKTPDPVCVGLRYSNEEERSKGYTWNMQKYLIGKWGDVKRSFIELTKLANDRFIKRKEVEYKQLAKDYQRKLDDLESEAFNRFGDNSSTQGLPF